MNSLLTASRLLQPIVDAPLWVVLLLKITGLLLAAWLAHLAIRRTNPRWRVFLWRMTAVGLIGLPAVAWLLPALEIRVAQPPVVVSEPVAVDLPVAGSIAEERSSFLPSPAGRGAGGEGREETKQVDGGVPPPKALTLTLSQRARGLREWTAANAKTLLLSAWLAGIAVLAFRLSVGHYQIRRLIGRTQPAPPAIQTECARVAQAIGCRSRVEVLQSPDVASPLLCGLCRPRLLLPARMCDDSYGQDLPGIVAHELTHVRSHDILWNLGLQLISIVLWFHPLVWRMRKAHLAACELVCDAASASFVGDAADYCRTLARVAVDACAALPAAGIAMARTSAISHRLSALRTRVFHSPLRRRSVLGVGLAALLAAVVLGALQLALAAPPVAEPVVVTDKAKPKAAVSVKATDKTTTKPMSTAAARDARKSVTLAGIVVDQDGRAEAGVTVKLFTHKDDEPTVISDAQGRFQFRIDSLRSGLTVLARTTDGARQAYYRSSREFAPQRTPWPPIRLTMSRARAIDVSVVDAAGKPVPAAVVGVVDSYEGLATGRSNHEGKCTLRIPSEARLQNIYAFKSGLGLDYVAFPPKDMASAESDTSHQSDANPSPILTLNGAKTARIKLVDPEGRPLAGVTVYPWYFIKQKAPHREPRKDLNISGVAAFYVKTDANGVALFDWLPGWNAGRVTFWSSDHAQKWVRERIMFDPQSGSDAVTTRLVRTVPLRGRVQFADGRPAEAIEVNAAGAGYQSLDGFHALVQTAADGRFEFHVHPDQFYMVAVNDPEWAAPAHTGIVVRPDAPVGGVDFRLQQATEIRGQVTIGHDKKPLVGQTVRLLQPGPDNLAAEIKKEFPNPAGNNRYVQATIVRWATADQQGRYTFHVGPGNYVVRGPDNSPSQKFSVEDQKSLVFDFNTPRANRGLITGRVVIEGKDARPVADAEVTGMSKSMRGHADLVVTADSQGRFRAERWLDTMLFHAKSKDGALAGTVQITGDDKEVTIPVQPMTSAEGRLMDATGGEPLAAREIRYSVRVYNLKEDGTPMGSWSNYFGGSVKTDASGRFKVAGLMIGSKYNFDVPNREEGRSPDSGGSSHGVGSVTVTGPGPIQLGDLKLQPRYHPPTPKERIAKAFESRKRNSESSIKPGFRLLSIHVSDSDVKPIRGAGITVRGMTSLPFGPTRYRTNAEGGATIEVPKEDVKDYQILVAKDRYVTAGAAWKGDGVGAEVPEKFLFTLERGTTIGGIVRDDQGKAVDGVEVTVEGRKTSPDGPRWTSIYETVRTDGEGRWRAHRIPKDLAGFELAVRLKRPDVGGVERFDGKALPLDKLQAQTAVNVMHRGVALEGTVTDPRGKPAVGASVGLMPELLRGDYPRTKTDQKGHYRFAVSEPGEYTVAAVTKDYAPDSRRVTVDKRPQTVDLRLRKGEMIRLRVVDKEGKPIARAVVSTVFDNAYRDALMLDYQSAFARDNDRHMAADAEGRWSRLWIPGDALTLLISKPGYGQLEKKIAPSEQEQVVTLEAGGWSVVGRVVDHQTKAPVTKFRVVEGYVYGTGDQDLTWRESRLIESKDGRYRAAWNTSGDSHRILRIEADGHLPSEPRRLNANERQVTWDFELSKGPDLAGTVRSTDGKPLADAEVALCTATRGLYLKNGRPLQGQPNFIVRTGVDGRFSLPPQPERYALIVLHDQGFARIENEQSAKEVTVRPWARVEGTLRIDNKPGVNQAVVINFDQDELRPPTPSVWGQMAKMIGIESRAAPRILFDYRTQTDAAGHYVFERVPPGKAKISRYVKLSQEGLMTSWKATNSKPVEFTPGETLKVDLGGTDGQ